MRSVPHLKLISALIVASLHSCKSSDSNPVDDCRSESARSLQLRYPDALWVIAEITETDQVRLIAKIVSIPEDHRIDRTSTPREPTRIIDQVDSFLKDSSLGAKLSGTPLTEGDRIEALISTDRDEDPSSTIALQPGTRRWLMIYRYMLRWHVVMIGNRST
jgi:hypothetical protein